MSFISDFLNKSKIEYNEEAYLSCISSFKIGGKAKYTVYPKNAEELVKIIDFTTSNEIKYEIIGNATNILFSNDGYDGIIIVTKKINKLSIDNDIIIADCGVRLSSISILAKNNSLSGFEFAHGIPGTLGGAVTMNAGAYGGEISNVIKYSYVYDVEKKSVTTLYTNDHRFGYRKSIFTENKNLICLASAIQLSSGNTTEIEKIMKANTDKRKASQPLEFPNCGSYFKSPAGFFAAKLIDDCSLKGYTVGGAAVSTKHAGFIINKSNATSDDVLELAKHIQAVVFEKYGIMLEPEVKYIH